jgi:DNA-binding transcriptional LysR family regulator
MQDVSWNDLRYVLAVARTGTLSSAAARLRVDPTTVSRRIGRTASIVSSRLFYRSGGMLVPTEAGQIVIAHAERIEFEVDRLKNTVADADTAISGSVRVTSVPILVNRVLIPALLELHNKNPLLQLELIADATNLSLNRRDADIAVRLARPHKEQSVVARRIGQLDYAVFGPSGRKARDLPWITYEQGMAALPQAAWIAKVIKHERADRSNLAVNDAEGVLQAIAAGLGKSLLPCAIGEQVKGLSRLGGRMPVLSREIWLLVHPELRHLGRIRAVTDWLERVVRGLGARERRHGRARNRDSVDPRV